jgi:hypothetical protein
MVERGTLAGVDDERGVFRVVEEAPGRAPTRWLLDSNRHWRAVRANCVHPVGDGCPRHPQAAAEAPRGAVRSAWRSGAVTIPSGRLAERDGRGARRPRRHHVYAAKE